MIAASKTIKFLNKLHLKQIPGGEREDAADIVARAAVPRVDQTFPLSVGR